MNLLYFNDLRALPNFGCRTTGTALEAMLQKNHALIRRDGLETTYNSGWDFLSPDCYKAGGLLPRNWHKFFWGRRFSHPSIYRKARRLDARFGAMHDYICENAAQSLERFHKFKRAYPALAELESQMAQTDGVAINGEGTLILGAPTKRDALYLLFVIALAASKRKPVFLLNAMIAQDPYAAAEKAMLEQAAGLLQCCPVIACRDHESMRFAKEVLGCSSVRMVPDALFTLGAEIRGAAAAVARDSGLVVPGGSAAGFQGLNFGEPYICVSASSSAWRTARETGAGLVRLANALKPAGLRIYFLSACAGDALLAAAAKEAGVTHIPQDIPVLAGAGIIAGAAVYITGRYHPAIMAGAGGVPTIFMGSNSHKTRSLQPLLGYAPPKEYPINPSAADIADMVADVHEMLAGREALAKKIRHHFDIQAGRAREYETLIDGPSRPVAK